MTPKDKAKELVGKMENTPHCGIEHFPSKHYCDCSEINFFQAKQCALIVVDEIISSRKDDTIFDDTFLLTSEYYSPHPMYLNYWLQVKDEINKI
jgi:hypothetical protein